MSNLFMSEKTPLRTKSIQGRSQSLEEGRSGAWNSGGRVPLPKLPSYSVNRFLSSEGLASDDGLGMDDLRLSFAAKLVSAAVDGRHVASAVDVFRGRKRRVLNHPAYNKFLILLILAHMLLAFWEGVDSPLSAGVVVAEATAASVYTFHMLLNLFTFGWHQFSDKRWHGVFSVLAMVHTLVSTCAILMAMWQGSWQAPEQGWCGTVAGE
ncbi:unnamed protein product, partial [Discosporangium mesarthrocarpum]